MADEQSEVKNAVLQKSKQALGLMSNSWRGTCGSAPVRRLLLLSQNTITMHEFIPVIHMLSPPRCFI